MTTFHERVIKLDMPIVLRLAREDDLPKLEWYGQYRHFRLVYRRTYREQILGHRLMILAVCRDFPIGQLFIQLRSKEGRVAEQGRKAYFYSLRVMDMFQNLGIGSRLLDEAEAVVGSLGYHSATIAAAKHNPDARRLYERRGFRVFAEDEGRWRYIDHKGMVRLVHEPCWLLEKSLFQE